MDFLTLLTSLTRNRQHFLNVTYLKGNIFSENKTSFKNGMKSETKHSSDGFSNISIKKLNIFGFFDMKKAKFNRATTTLFKCYLFKKNSTLLASLT